MKIRPGRRPSPARNSTVVAACEPLEPRYACSVTVGTLGFLSLGGATADTGNLATATSFTLNNVFSTGATGSPGTYFNGLPTQSFGSFSFDTTVGTSLSFSTAAFGSFTSTVITETSNVPGFRTFQILGTLTGGTYGGVTTPDPAPSIITMGFTQSPPGTGVISNSFTISMPPPTPPSEDILVAADDVGCTSTPRVYVINPYTGNVTTSFIAYPDARFRGGVRVAVGDVDGDGTLDIVTAAGPGRAGEVKVFDLAGNPKPGFTYFPFGSSYRSGVDIALGDVDGDGRADLVSSASRGAGAVNVARNTGAAFVSQPAKSFVAFGTNHTGGATVAVSGVNKIVVGSGVGLQPTVKVYDVSGPSPTSTTFLPNPPTGTGGITVSSKFFNVSASPEIVTAGGFNAGSAIGVYRNQTDPAIRQYATFGAGPRPNSPVYAAAAALSSSVVDTVFMSQGLGGTGSILKVNAMTGAVDPSFAPTFNGRRLSGPLRIATRTSV